MSLNNTNLSSATVKLSLLLPSDIDRQLRALAARQGVGVGSLVREWIIDVLVYDESPMSNDEAIAVSLSGVQGEG